MKLVTVDSVSDFIRGITFKPHELIAVDDPDAVVCMRTKNIQRDLDERDLIAVPTRLVRSESKLLRAGDILISSANSWELVGKCAYVSELSYRATAGGFIAIVRPKSHTHPRFLYHWLNSPTVQDAIRNLGRQTTNISNLDVKRFKELGFPDIGLREQHRIATILDKADIVRRKREHALMLADEFLKSSSLQIFGDPVSNPFDWNLGKFSDCLTGIAAGWSAVGEARPARSDEFGVLKISAVTSGEYLPNENKAVAAVPPDRSLIIPKEGDLLFSRANTRELVAATCIVTEAKPNVFLPDKLWRLDCDNQVATPIYLKFVLSHPVFRQHLCSRATGTSGSMLNISKSKLMAHPIALPPSDLQARFTVIWQAAQRAGKHQREGLTLANDQFAALSQSAFRGEL